MERTLDQVPGWPRPRRVIRLGLLFVLLVILLLMGPFRTIPAGHVGVKDFFGSVSPSGKGSKRPRTWPPARTRRWS
jgi:hypothetical protein